MTRALVALVTLAALAACTDYAHLSVHNGPGMVDLDQPLERENGDPKRFESPKDPGNETITIFAAPYILGGSGRLRPGSGGTGEVGLEMRVEHLASETYDLLDKQNWGVTTGLGFAQWGDGVRTIAPGAFFAELNYRFIAKYWPIDLGLGPAFYVDGTEVGGQATVRIAIFMLRARYMADHGGEVFGGAEIPIPFFFSWSR